jgi:transcriptional regulator with XRE-family HTH domain
MPRPFAVQNPLGRRLEYFNLSVSELANRSGVSSRTLTEYLAGRAEMLDHHLTALADVLEVDPEDLLPQP